MTTVALIGPDGAGKTSVARAVVARLAPRARYLYMGVNLDSSRLMLPTTRLALALKHARGGRGDLQGFAPRSGADGRPHGAIRALHAGRSVLRLANWIAEEWFRQCVAWYHERRGLLVVFDRHFFCDYYADHVAPERSAGRSRWGKIHGFVLDRLYPKPDLVICLDARAAVLHARKGEGTLESIERRRREYLALDRVVPRFTLVDADRSISAVVEDVALAIGRATGDWPPRDDAARARLAPRALGDREASQQ